MFFGWAARSGRGADLRGATARVIEMPDLILRSGSLMSSRPMTYEPPLILAIGDSLIAGYGLPAADSFPNQLTRALQQRFPGTRVLNGGVSGDTTGDVLRRLPRLLSSLERRPALAIVQVGPNDVLRQTPAARTRAQLEQIMLDLTGCGIPILLTTVDAPAFIRDRAKAYLDIHPRLAAEHGAVTCPFFPTGVLGRADMVLADRVHPNAKAIAAVVAGMAPTIERMIGSVGHQI
jgi:acyl-CoA thioesterase-1